VGSIERRYCCKAGQLWAVEIRDGQVVRGAGPIEPAAATEKMLPYFPYDERSLCVSSCPDALNCPYAYRQASETA
jgi:hypothetical protein